MSEALSAPVARAAVPGFGALELHRLDPDRDAPLVHGWVTEERARFWMMQDHSLEEVREVYTWIAGQPGLRAWLLRLDGEPVALLQDYLPEAEPVGEHYDVLPGDRGIHLLLAPPTGHRPGHSRTLLRFFLDFVLADPDVERVVVEPDVANEKSLRLLTRLGFEPDRVLDLPHKRARLAFLLRDRHQPLAAG
ncbi:GNAT family N-acetyltransferase [Nocardioides sp. GCM10027113]|uniref:GNAT family N-acetyltransferase n=1 Tax=unclassified Nocardioides TaxID=2615069 RepID=UPI00360C1971